VKYGLHWFASALLLNIWFVIALSVQAGYRLDHTHTTRGRRPCTARSPRRHTWVSMRGPELRTGFLPCQGCFSDQRDVLQPGLAGLPVHRTYSTRIALIKPSVSWRLESVL